MQIGVLIIGSLYWDESVPLPAARPDDNPPRRFQFLRIRDVNQNETVAFDPDAVHDVAEPRIDMVDALQGMPAGARRLLPVLHRDAGARGGRGAIRAAARLLPHRARRQHGPHGASRRRRGRGTADERQRELLDET